MTDSTASARRDSDRGPEAQELRIPTLPPARRVLVPIDFTPLAVHAIPWAYALAGPGGCVVLVHVVDPELPPNPLYAHYRPGHAHSDEERSRSDAELRERLGGLAPASAIRDGISTEVEVVAHAKVSGGVREVAQRLQIDAICIGSHCRGAMGRTVLGSITEALLRAADTPLFVVPAPRG
jgi:nucleotide-binding universal stress UspA family protein